MKSKASSIVIIWMCCLMQADLTAQPVVAESHYRFQHYLPSEWIRSIAQDSLGFIWTQGASRVYRFDGYDFKVFKHDPDDTTRSLPRNTIQNIVSDPRGGIWITYHTPGHGFPLARYDIGTDAFIKYNTNVPFGANTPSAARNVKRLRKFLA